VRLIDADAYGDWLQQRREQARADGDMAMYGLRSAKLHLDAAPTVSCAECAFYCTTADDDSCAWHGGCRCGGHFERREPVWNDNRPAGCKQWDKENP
jgi:hypothetical protein